MKSPCFEPYDCAFAPLEKVDLLHAAVNDYLMLKEQEAEALKYRTIKKLNEQISRLSECHWYLRVDTHKVTQLGELINRIEQIPNDTPHIHERIQTVISTWEDETVEQLASSSRNLNNKQLMGQHRCIFFKPEREGKTTKTQDNLADLKTSLLNHSI